ncbi:MAG: V-type ATP synthase subunit D [Kineosporiaceae bacterium]|nr:V-type ATP synthase subunit D [Kineosporiaceae bacterium]
MTAPVAATRTGLLDLRRNASFAEQGRDLLRDKRSALIREFGRVQTELLGRIEDLRRQAARARAAHDAAVITHGPEHVLSASLHTATGIPVTLVQRAVAGVVVVDLDHEPIERRATERGYALLTTSAAVDEVATTHERELELLLQVCAVELTVRRLAAEIDRTTRQVNALDAVVIPGLRAQARQVAVVLEEREREELARLKRARDRRRSPAPAPTRRADS